MSLKVCPECYQPVEDPETGRPRTYCGEGCKRAAGYRLTRLNRLLFRLESWLLDLRLERGDYQHLYYARERKAAAVKLQREIDAIEARMRALLVGAEAER